MGAHGGKRRAIAPSGRKALRRNEGAGRRSGRGRRSGLVVEIVAVLLLVGVTAGAFWWHWKGAAAHTGSGDSYWYLQQAARAAGMSDADASRAAGDLYCAEVRRAHDLGSLRYSCTTYDVSAVPQRYVAIFTSRPGHPWALAPLVAAFGLARGAMLGTAVFFVGVSLLLSAALRAHGTHRLPAFTGGALVAVLPGAYWNSRMLAEGAATCATLLALLAVLLLARRHAPGPAPGGGVEASTAPAGALPRPRASAEAASQTPVEDRTAWRRRGRSPRAAVTGPRVRAAVVLLVVALAAAFLTKSAQGAAISLALLPVALGWAVTRSVPWRGWLAAGAVPALALAAWTATSVALRLPGLTETVQDLATAHFRRPDIAEPLPYLAHAALRLWRGLPRVLGLPWPMVVVLVACVLLLVLRRRAGLVWTAPAVAAVLVATAHPMASQYPRLVAGVWVTVAAAAAATLDAALRPLLPRPRAVPQPRSDTAHLTPAELAAQRAAAVKPLPGRVSAIPRPTSRSVERALTGSDQIAPTESTTLA